MLIGNLIPRLADYFERLGRAGIFLTLALWEGITPPFKIFPIIKQSYFIGARSFFVILAAGTGNPFFTTDSAASLRAVELNVDLLVKATKVDGVFTADPMKDPSATLYSSLSYDKVLSGNLGVMDATAIVMCRDHNVKLRVVNIFNEGALMKLVCGESVGTLVEKAVEA